MTSSRPGGRLSPLGLMCDESDDVDPMRSIGPAMQVCE